jgi:hypothetical protein
MLVVLLSASLTACGDDAEPIADTTTTTTTTAHDPYQVVCPGRVARSIADGEHASPRPATNEPDEALRSFLSEPAPTLASKVPPDLETQRDNNPDGFSYRAKSATDGEARYREGNELTAFFHLEHSGDRWAVVSHEMCAELYG